MILILIKERHINRIMWSNKEILKIIQVFKI